MGDMAKFNVGWTAMCIGLYWAFIPTLPCFALFVVYMTKTPSSSTFIDFDFLASSMWSGMLWLCLGAFWSRALTAFTVPNEETKAYEDAPVPLFLGLFGLAIFERVILLALSIHATPAKWPVLLEAFSFQTLTFLGGMAIGLTYGKTFGRSQRGRAMGLGPWLLQKTRSATVGRGLRGPRRYSLCFHLPTEQISTRLSVR